jgi:hypothetical protein
MSFLKSKHSGWASDGTRTPYMGGGGGGGPSQNTTVTSNIPEYAKPYVTNMFEATQQQLFTGNKTPEGGYNITGFRGYQPYSSNVSDYYAGFSPLQQQAQFDAGAMQQPGQFALGSGLTGAAGMRSLQAGNQFGQSVTNKQRVDTAGKPMFDPVTNQPLFDASNTTQSFMSPYQQGVTDVAKQAAVREAQMAQNAQNLMSPRQGTYGGARQTLAGMERERNLLSNLSNIQTQGSQAAYDKAMQTQQFGANLGMQGLGQAMGAGAQLGQLGATQQGADIARQNQMATMGQQQQGLEQSKINQAIQDYATQQQYPLMQLGFMSNMLRGLPMQSATTQSYQAQPSPITQGLGVLAGAAGAKQAGLFKEGGTIKGLASGGVTGYANRGMVQSNPNSGVVQGIRQKLEMMPAQQLEQVAKTSSSEEVRAMAIEILREKQLRDQAEMQAQQSIMQDQRSMPTPVSQNMGISAAPAGSMDTLSAASGGIVAFAGDTDGSQVELDLEKEFAARQKAAEFVKRQREAAGIGAPKAAMADYYAKEQTSLGEDEKKARGYDLLSYGLNLAGEAGSLPSAAARAGQKTLPGMISRQEGLRGRRGEVAKGLAEVAEGERLVKAGDIEAGNAMFEKGQDRINREKIAKIQAQSSAASANRATDADKRIETIRQAIIAKLPENQRAAAQKDPAIAEQAQSQYFRDVNLAGPKLNIQEETAADRAVKDSKAIKDLRRNQAQYDPGSKEHGDLQEQIKAEEAKIRGRYAGGTSPVPIPTPAPAAVQALPMPTAQSDLVKGKVYNTARGPAKWNGSAFVAVQ